MWLDLTKRQDTSRLLGESWSLKHTFIHLNNHLGQEIHGDDDAKHFELYMDCVPLFGAFVPHYI